MFTKSFLNILILTTGINAYVIDREIFELKNIPKLKVNLSFQHPEVRGGLYQGDIIVTDFGEIENSKIAWNFEKYPIKKWQNRVIPYRISGLYTEYDVATINVAINTLNRLSCLKFKPHDEEDDFLFIWPVKYPKGCFSFIGRQGGAQILSLDPSDTYGDNCLSADGIIIHELMHSAGIFHEQSRTDRDNYVEIIYDNIIPEMKSNFEKMTPMDVSYDFEYDYKSVMHYGTNYFAIDPKKPTIVVKNSIGKESIGQRNGLSIIDCLKLNILYGCFDEKKLERKYKQRCFALGIN